MKKQKIEDLLEILESKDVNYQNFEELAESAFEEKSLNINISDIVRIEEKVDFYWSGVSGCNNNATAQTEYKKTLTKWVKNQMFEHRNWRWVKYGIIEATGRCSQSRDRWTNVRTCRCSGKLNCYIEFRKI